MNCVTIASKFETRNASTTFDIKMNGTTTGKSPGRRNRIGPALTVDILGNLCTVIESHPWEVVNDIVESAATPAIKRAKWVTKLSSESTDLITDRTGDDLTFALRASSIGYGARAGLQIRIPLFVLSKRIPRRDYTAIH